MLWNHTQSIPDSSHDVTEIQIQPFLHPIADRSTILNRSRRHESTATTLPIIPPPPTAGDDTTWRGQPMADRYTNTSDRGGACARMRSRGTKSHEQDWLIEKKECVLEGSLKYPLIYEICFPSDHYSLSLPPYIAVKLNTMRRDLGSNLIVRNQEKGNDDHESEQSKPRHPS